MKKSSKRLTPPEIRQIRADYPRLSLAQLAQRFGCTRQNIHAIVRRRTFAWVPDVEPDWVREERLRREERLG